jgi:ABC-type Na+ efflux pump permease subunit
MTVLPIAERELRVAARRGAMYRDRVIVAIMGLVFSGWLLFFFQKIGGPFRGPLGSQTFQSLTSFMLIFCFFSGFAVCDSLSAEKREGTLGLLFLTDLRSYDIIAGKLLAQSTGYFYALVSLVPVLAIPLLMGGVEFNQVFRMTLVLLNTIFLSMSFGLFASAFCRERSTSRNVCMLLVMIFWVVIPGITQLVQVANLPPWLGHLDLISPAKGKLLAFGNAPARFDQFWLTFFCTNAVSWIFLGLACFRLPTAWQDRPVQKPVRERIQGGRFFKPAAQRPLVRRMLLDRNPFLWLASRNSLDPLATLLAFGLVITIGIFFMFRTKGAVPASAIPLLTAGLFHLAFRFRLAEMAARRLIAEREAGTMEWLLSTPLNVSDIISGQLKALWRQLSPAFGLVLVVDLVAWGTFASGAGGDSAESRFYGSIVCGAAVIVFLIDCITLCWVSMLMALKVKVARKAAGEAIGRVLVLPWGIFVVALTLLAFFEGLVSARAEPSFATVLLIWLFIALGVDAFYYFRARRKLVADFRTLAVQRLQDPAKHWFKRLFSKPSLVPPVIQKSSG